MRFKKHVGYGEVVTNSGSRSCKLGTCRDDILLLGKTKGANDRILEIFGLADVMGLQSWMLWWINR